MFTATLTARTSSHGPARHPRLRRPLALPVFCTNFLVACIFMVLACPFQRALACATPPPSDCSLTVAIIISCPRVVIGGPNPVLVIVRALVFIGSNAGVAGSTPCPSRGGTDINITTICTPGPDPASPATVTLPTLSGSYAVDIPVTFPAGPPRTCALTGTAVSHYTARNITATSNTQVCIVDPAPGNPSKPRLDLQLLSPPSQLAHPGDQRTHVYRVTNNDPVHSVSGTLTSTANQGGRMTVSTPPSSPGDPTQPTSAASPFTGDAFPLQFTELSRPPALGPNNYSTDDGVAEDGIGLSPSGALIWLNDFTVLPGQTIIDRVSVAFGASTPAGKPVVLGLWSDPNNDGNPADAQLLMTTDVATPSGGAGLFNDYPFPPTTVGPVGSHFFVGAMIQSTANPPELPAAIDRSSDAGRSWVTFADPCEGNMGSLSDNAIAPMHPAAFGFSGNFLIRAHSASTAGLRQWITLGDPGAASTLSISRSITLCPGESRLIAINQRSFRMCRTGACSHSLTSFSGTFSNATPAVACAGAGMMVDSSVAPDFRCVDAGVMTLCSTTTPAGSLRFTGTMPTHALDARVRLVNVQITPQGFPQPNFQPTLTGILDADLPNHNEGRITAPAFFPVPIPSGTPMQVSITLELLSLIAAQTITLQPPDPAHAGDPALGDSYFFINDHLRITGPGIPPTLDSFFDVFQSVSLDGIDTLLRHHRTTVIYPSITITPISPSTFSVNFTVTVPFDPALPNPITRANVNIDSLGNGYGIQGAPRCPIINALTDARSANFNTGPVNLSVSAEGDEPMTYQWSFNGVPMVPLVESPRRSGINSPSLIINPVRSSDAGNYTCRVTNSCGIATSAPITLTVRCPADFNGVGGLTVQDIFDFLSAWFSGDPRADFNGSGSITVQDIFDFLSAWFAGCNP